MREAKVVASEIAQCHFVVHYPLDGSVRRGMNEKSVFLCRKHALAFAWPCDSWIEKMYFLACLLTYSTVRVPACLATLMSHQHVLMARARLLRDLLQCHSRLYAERTEKLHARPHCNPRDKSMQDCGETKLSETRRGASWMQVGVWDTPFLLF